MPHSAEGWVCQLASGLLYVVAERVNQEILTSFISWLMLLPQSNIHKASMPIDFGSRSAVRVLLHHDSHLTSDRVFDKCTWPLRDCQAFCYLINLQVPSVPCLRVFQICYDASCNPPGLLLAVLFVLGCRMKETQILCSYTLWALLRP